jgi:hypothetical protein
LPFGCGSDIREPVRQLMALPRPDSGAGVAADDDRTSKLTEPLCKIVILVVIKL